MAEAYAISLANKGLVMHYNEDYNLSPEAMEAADVAAQGIVQGSISIFGVSDL
ncbi:MAG: hypothetical protein R2880_17595 [Deinococcales bacterium]